ncbi:MAG: LAGLIDADG family homing endonuclease [bacterium]|nr:LAGLIDADG family homing endonuclease [bacterium]
MDTQTKPSIPNTAYAIAQKDLGVLDIIAPQKIEVDFDFIKINDVFFRTLFIAGYPRTVAAGWLEGIVNFNNSLDISFYIYPIEGKSVLDDLRRKIAEMEAELSTDFQRGKIADPATEAKLEDAKTLQEQLVKGAERFYEFAFYITIPAPSLEELNHLTKQVESTLGSLMITSRHAILDMENGFTTTAPFGMDRLSITRNMDTSSLSTTFPLTSAELSSDKGVLYGINSKNESFIIFDRFSLENNNMTVIATSGAGKSTSYDTEVIYKNSAGQIKKEKIGEIVDSAMITNEPEKIEEGIMGVNNPGIKVLSFDNNLKGNWSEVTIAARKKSPKYLYRISTRSGRQIEITKDHCLVTLKDGEVQTLKGDLARVGDYLPLPREIKYGGCLPETINTYEALKKSPIKYLRKLKGRVGNRLIKKSGSIPENIKPDSDFFTFLGLLASEGMVAYKRVLISNTDPEILKFVAKYFDSLEIRFNYIFKNKKKIGVNVFSETFVEFLKATGSAGKSAKKKIPDIVFSAPTQKAADFLKAYFEGDGSVEKHAITATTKSKQLASDVLYLLYRFGIVARIATRKKSATNTKEKRVGTYYAINISGQENIKSFIENVGFLSERKNKKAELLIKQANTNVDLVPGLEQVFMKIYKELYSSKLSAPENFSDIKLGTTMPSRQNLLGVVSKIKERIRQIENLETDGLSKLQRLPTVKEIVDNGKEKTMNSQLWAKMGGSWSTMRAGIPPNTKNALAAASITHGYEYEIDEVGRALYRCFKYSGESLQKYDSPLWETVLYKHANARYGKIIKARDYISKVYKNKINNLQKIKGCVNWLEKLATSGLFWDPIAKIEKFRSKNKYVYDLQVDSGVFLAGQAGLFIHNSFFVKLEALRSLMLGTEVIIIDPEAEYKPLAQAVGGEFVSFSFNSPSKINPFDLAQVYEEGENQLGLKVLSLHSLFKVIMGTITPIQEALLDRAIIMAYKGKGITQDPATQKNEPPLMEDLYKILTGMETPDALDLAARIEKFVKGSFVGMFDKQTNINLNNPFTVFSVRDLQDALRPIAMFIILDYIWTRVKKDIKKRILIVEEAWHMMKFPDTAQFLWSVVKRARKYYLGLTTITQDVEDFLSQDIGKAIVTNSALQVLLKQSPAAIDKVGEVFYLSQGEKQLLMGANIGEGIFFAGHHRAPIRVIASKDEYQLITTRPQDIVK